MGFKVALLLFLTVCDVFTGVLAGESLFETAGKIAAGHGREFLGDNTEKLNKQKTMSGSDVINAGDIWNDEGMKKMLGISDEEDANEGEKTEHSDENQEVPSLLSALYNKLNEPETKILPRKCKLPGMKGNVVRMLHNKGSILYQNDKYTILELQFSMKNALHEYENVTEALLKVALPDVRSQYREAWVWLAKNGILSIPRYRYEIYFTNDDTVRNIRHEISKRKTFQKAMEGITNSFLRVKAGLPKPILTARQTPKYSVESQKVSLDVTPLVDKWKNTFFQKRKMAFGRGLLIVTMETGSTVTKQCIRPVISKPRLLLVSIDVRQCPMDMTPYVFDDDASETAATEATDAIKRRKRDVGEGKVKGKRRRKGRRRGKSKTNTTIAPAVTSRKDENPFRSPDLNQSRPLHGFQTRTTRSTICRRYPMYVTFDDVGWGQWIIAPRGYQAYRCSGDCPFPLGGKLNGTNHAVLVTMMHSVEPWSTPQPCCVPTVLKPMSLLYFDTDGGVVLRQYEDMIVSTCGCR